MGIEGRDSGEYSKEVTVTDMVVLVDEVGRSRGREELKIGYVNGSDGVLVS